MDATESSRARLTDTCPVPKIHMPARRRTGRHHLVIPGDIISERPGDFVGIGSMTRTAIYKELFGSNTKAGTIANALSELLAAGKVWKHRVDTNGGRPSYTFFAV